MHLTYEGAAMGFLDKLKGQAAELKTKAVDAVDKNSGKIHSGIDKAGEFVDKKTKGKYSDKIETAKAKAEQGLERLDGKKDDFTGQDTETGPQTGVTEVPDAGPASGPAVGPTSGPSVPPIARPEPDVDEQPH
jgi:hypothetical protein